MKTVPRCGVLAPLGAIGTLPIAHVALSFVASRHVSRENREEEMTLLLMMYNLCVAGSHQRIGEEILIVRIDIVIVRIEFP